MAAHPINFSYKHVNNYHKYEQVPTLVRALMTGQIHDSAPAAL